MCTLSILKIDVFWNKGYDVIISLYDFNSKILSRDSDYIVCIVMWPKLSNSRISKNEVIVNSILFGFDQKNHLFARCSWFKFNNLGLALPMALIFYTGLAKELKLRVRRFWGLIPTFVEVTGEKLIRGEGGGHFWPPPPYPYQIELTH